jgi:hypothetical protein
LENSRECCSWKLFLNLFVLETYSKIADVRDSIVDGSDVPILLKNSKYYLMAKLFTP